MSTTTHLPSPPPRYSLLFDGAEYVIHDTLRVREVARFTLARAACEELDRLNAAAYCR